jgi:hypothetical protein
MFQPIPFGSSGDTHLHKKKKNPKKPPAVSNFFRIAELKTDKYITQSDLGKPSKRGLSILNSYFHTLKQT